MITVYGKLKKARTPNSSGYIYSIKDEYMQFNTLEVAMEYIKMIKELTGEVVGFKEWGS